MTIKLPTPGSAAATSPPKRPQATRPSVPNRPASSSPEPSNAGSSPWDELPSPPSTYPTGYGEPNYGSSNYGVPSYGGATYSYGGGGGTTYRKRKKGPNNGLKYTLIGCGSLLGVGILGLVGFLVLGLVVGAVGSRKTTLTLAGYSVDAPGIRAPGKVENGMRSIFALNMATNSEFKLVMRSGEPGFDLFGFVRELQSEGLYTGDVIPITRAGLNGYQLTDIVNVSGKEFRSRWEIYKTNDTDILLLGYITGMHMQALGFGWTRRSEADTKRLDDPDAFFASLRKAGP